MVTSLLDRLLRQDEPSIEIVVIDDGSTDDTSARLYPYRAKVKVLRQENLGPSAARNKGIKHAAAEYIKFLDSDDFCDFSTVMELYNYGLTLREKQIALGDALVLDRFREVSKESARFGYEDCEPYREIPRLNFFKRDTPSWLALYPKKALLEVGMFDPSLWLGEDTDITFRLLSAGYAFYRFPKHVTVSVQHYGERLTTQSVEYRALHQELAFIKNLNMNFPKLSLTNDEKEAFAQKLWIFARDIAREGEHKLADNLFRTAFSVAGQNAYVGNALIKKAYRWMTPSNAERISVFLKSLF